ncbi:MAG: peroxide stress protein YaaA [Eubacteriales bacterium]
MRIIISPAKKMKLDVDTMVPTRPQLFQEATAILAKLRTLNEVELQNLWQCNDSITAQNVRRLETMDLSRNLTPAVLAYEGIQYQYMAPAVFETTHFDYISAHLRILSGFYGLLKPLDGVSPYRLEMQAKLPVDGAKHLYDFWGSKLADQLVSETNLVVNLASKEYSKAVLPHLPQDVQVITCHFKEWKGDKLVEKATMCKMARGQMVRYLAECQGTKPEDIQGFNQLNFQFSQVESSENQYVFIKGE